MSTKSGRTVLLQAASFLVLSGGLAFAQTAINQGPDDESVPDLPPGFVVNSATPIAVPELPLVTKPEPGAAATVQVTDPSDLIGRRPAVDTESTPDIAPGMVTQPVSAPEAVVHAPFMTWELSQWQGATIRTDTGETLGTVETLAYDPTDRLYLITDLAAVEPGAGRRAIPMESVGYNPATGDLQVDAVTAQRIAAMMDYDQVANGYSELGSDLEYRELTGMFGDPL